MRPNFPFGNFVTGKEEPIKGLRLPSTNFKKGWNQIEIKRLRGRYYVWQQTYNVSHFRLIVKNKSTGKEFENNPLNLNIKPKIRIF